MKCVNCNGEVDSQAIKCPYCGSRNEAGIQFNKQVYEKIHRNKLLAPFLLKQQTPELIQKVLGRVILAMAGAGLALFVICIVLILWMDRETREEPKAGSYAEAYEEANTYNNSDYFSFIRETNVFIDAWEAGNKIDVYDVENMIYYSYRMIHEEDKLEPEYKKKAMLEIDMIYRDMLGLTEEEMALFDTREPRYQYSDYMTNEVKAQLTEIVCEKLGGLLEE